MVKNLLEMQVTQVQFMGQKDPLEKGMTTHSSLEDSMDRGAWWVTVHGITKSRTRLTDFTFTFTLGHCRTLNGISWWLRW